MTSGPAPIRPTGLGPAAIAAASIQLAQTRKGLTFQGRQELKPEIRDSRAIQDCLETSAEAGGEGTGWAAGSPPPHAAEPESDRAGDGEGEAHLDLLG